MTYETSHDYGQDPGYEHQMSPLKGGRYAKVFHGPPGTDVGDLYCDLEPFIMGATPITINHSGWQPSEQHIKQLESGGHIRLTVWQHPIPPLAVSVEPPVCACHDLPMVWDEDSEGYNCQTVVTRERLDEAHRYFTAGAEE